MADDRVTLRVHWQLLLLSIFFCARCSADEPFALCGAPNYEVWNLTTKIWTFKAPKEACLTPSTNGTTEDGCEITMAFCQALDVSSHCNNSAVCETYSFSNDTYNLATYTHGSNPFTIDESVKGFTTSYGSGEVYANKTLNCTLKTEMTFVCNSTAVWDKTPVGIANVPVTPNIQFIQEQNICTYSFRFDFAGACEVIIPGTPPSELSPGSILLLIFFITVIMYFVMGCLVNIARGNEERIPHQKFWAMLPVYIMDGCQFACSCGKKQKNSAYESI